MSNMLLEIRYFRKSCDYFILDFQNKITYVQFVLNIAKLFIIVTSFILRSIIKLFS